MNAVRRTRVLAAALATGLAGATLTALAAPAATAVTVTAPVTFTDCDVLLDGNKVSDGPDWTPTLTVDHPSPVAVGAGVTLEIDTSDLPGGTFPEDLYDAKLDYYLYFATVDGGTQTFVGHRNYATVDASEPLVFGELEDDQWVYLDSGRYGWAPTSIEIGLYALRSSDDELVYYTYECDQDAAPDALFDVGVFDPDAPATLVADTFSAKQGETFVVTGQDFPREATDDPDTDVDVYVGDDLAASFDVDDIGSFSGVVQVPQFAKTGSSVDVRAVAVGETGATVMQVKAKKAKLDRPKTTKPGQKVTISGKGFKPGDKVKLSLKRKGKAKGKTSFGSTVKADGSGKISKKIKLKKAATGTWKVTAKGPKSHRTGTTSFKVR